MQLLEVFGDAQRLPGPYQLMFLSSMTCTDWLYMPVYPPRHSLLDTIILCDILKCRHSNMHSILPFVTPGNLGILCKASLVLDYIITSLPAYRNFKRPIDAMNCRRLSFVMNCLEWRIALQQFLWDNSP